MRLEFSKNTRCTRAFALVIEGWNAVVQDGFTPEYFGDTPFDSSCHIMHVVSPDEDVVGVLVVREDPEACVFDIKLAYVEPSSRRQGVFRLLMEALLDRAKQTGIKTIRVTSYGEAPFAPAFAKFGLVPAATVYERLL